MTSAREGAYDVRIHEGPRRRVHKRAEVRRRQCRGGWKDQMLDRSPGLISGVLFSMMFLTTLSGCKKPEPPPPPPGVTVARPVQREVIEWDEYTGHLEPVETVEVRARVSGFIERAEFDEGTMVKAGQLLFVIDPRPFEAELAQQQAEVQRAQAQRDFAANDFKRLENLRPGGGAYSWPPPASGPRLRPCSAATAPASRN